MDRASEPRPLMSVPRAAFYFALVYFSQGVCQLSTLLNQPVRMYLERVAHYDATRISEFFFVAIIPWMIKPAYGLLSDFFPLFGYRRKSYLLLLNVLATVAFALVAGIDNVNTLLIMLTLTGVSVAASDVIVDAMMVQTGQETGRTRLFQGAQWFSLSAAAILSGLVGSYLCRRWENDPPAALKTAALIAMCVPLIVAVLTWLLVADQRTAINLHEFKATAKALLLAFASPHLWLVVVFLFLIHFNPGVETALYDHLTRHLGITHAYRALLDMMLSGGKVIGALIFMLALSGRISTKRAVMIGLIVGALGLLPLMAISGRISAAIAYSIYGVTYMIASLSQLTVAAEACPKRVEAVVFAALMSVCNLSMQYSDVLGSRLYDGALRQHIQPLILASAALTAAGLIFVPIIRPHRHVS